MSGSEQVIQGWKSLFFVHLCTQRRCLKAYCNSHQESFTGNVYSDWKLLLAFKEVSTDLLAAFTRDCRV